MTRFGVQLPNFSGPSSDQLFEDVANLASAVEDAGFDSLWVMDHFFQLPALGGPDQPMLESYTLLGALAAKTGRVELGTLVTGVTYRNPGILAKIVTTLDVISKGRAVLGIGAAWYDVEHHALGVTFPADGVRLDMLEEAVQICHAMFRDDDVSFDGTYFHMDHARNLPRDRPARWPADHDRRRWGEANPPSRRPIRDRCNVTGDVETLTRKIEVLHAHCADVGHDPRRSRSPG